MSRDDDANSTGATPYTRALNVRVLGIEQLGSGHVVQVVADPWCVALRNCASPPSRPMLGAHRRARRVSP